MRVIAGEDEESEPGPTRTFATTEEYNEYMENEWAKEAEESLSRVLEAWGPFLQCLEDETLLRMVFSNNDSEEQLELSDATWNCIRAGFGAMDLRTILSNPFAAFSLAFYSIPLTVPCMSDQEWEQVMQEQEAEPGTLQWEPELKQTMECVMEAYGGPKGIGRQIEYLFLYPEGSDEWKEHYSALEEQGEKCADG